MKPEVFQRCVGCKSEDTKTDRAFLCPDGEKRIVCRCACGGEWFLPNEADLKFYEHATYHDITSWLARVMRQSSLYAHK